MSAALLIIREFYPAYDLRALCELSGIPFTVESVPYARCEASGDFPQVVHGSVIAGGPRAFAYVRSMTTGTHLLNKQPRAVDAFESMAGGVLRDVEMWSRYADDTHFVKITRPSMFAAMQLPLSLFAVPALRKECVVRAGGCCGRVFER